MGHIRLYSLAFSHTVEAILNSASEDEVKSATELFDDLLTDPQPDGDTKVIASHYGDDEVIAASNAYWSVAYVVENYEVTILRIIRLPKPVTNPVRYFKP